ncbi:MAG: single-stranded-DNA-specific exonuclease RecJ [Pseudomonadota bacterium]
MIKKIVHNYVSHASVYKQALKQRCTPLQATIVANRCAQPEQLEQFIHSTLSVVEPPSHLCDSHFASLRLVEAIKQDQHIGILTDYDVDGITSHAIMLFALRDFFYVKAENISSFIGHRLNDGYGVSQGLIDKILAQQPLPDIIITADCGSSDEKQIKQLKEAGIDVIVTDHHAIPESGIPVSAYATINPTRKDCNYQDKTIAGCMVSWLLMSQLRADLIVAGIISSSSAKLSTLLDFVSLGTIADAVSLSSYSNRAVVRAGLKIMNRLQRPCWREMLKLIGKDFFTIEDLGFQMGPRINARSRMSDPFQALFFVTAERDQQAQQTLATLDEDNKLRKATEKEMLFKAKTLARQHIKQYHYSMVVFDPDFHAGVQGIVASRLVDQYGRPTVVFSVSANPDIITASARTVSAVHIRDILQQISSLKPELLISFGGHKGAAGLKIKKTQLDEFKTLFEQQIQQQMHSDKKEREQALQPILLIDGALTAQQLCYQSVVQLEQLQPYGREFEKPSFKNQFIVQFIRHLGKDGEHLSLLLVHENQVIRSIWFNALEKDEFPEFVEGDTVEVVYQLMKDDYRGEGNFQLNIRYIELVS